MSSGTTLKENNLKEIEGRVVLESQVRFLYFLRVTLEVLWLSGSYHDFARSCLSLEINCFQAILVASQRALIQRKGVLDTTYEILERLEAHLRA